MERHEPLENTAPKKDKSMNEEEARDHARDSRTVERAVSDAKAGNYDAPVKVLDTLLPGGLSDQKLHDEKVYNAAYKEAKKHRD